jgi:CheY-like chemotaxis protein
MTEKGNSETQYFRPPAKVVLVDDSELNRDFIRMAFKMPNYEIFTASEGLEGIELINHIQPELILLDIMMPGLDGYDVAAVLKEDPKTTNIPIIFITALNDIQDKLKAFEAGAVDFVTKPFNHRELIARVRTNIENHRLMRQKDDMMNIAMREKRNSAISRIAGGISHNINNMLCGAFGNIDLLKMLLEDKLDETASGAFDDLKASLEKILLLSTRFLVLSGHQHPVSSGEASNKEANLKEVVNNFIENTKDQRCHAKTEYINNIPEDTVVKFDSNLIFEFLQLVVQETLDAAQKAARFDFSVEKNEEDKLAFSVAIESDINLPPDIEDFIFEPFALPAANVGSGLAFSVAKNIIERNGASVTAKVPDSNHISFCIVF